MVVVPTVAKCLHQTLTVDGSFEFLNPEYHATCRWSFFFEDFDTPQSEPLWGKVALLHPHGVGSSGKSVRSYKGLSGNLLGQVMGCHRFKSLVKSLIRCFVEVYQE